MNGPDNPIGWCDYTINPVTGCKHGCRFHDATCYAGRIAHRYRGTKAWPDGFAPTFHEHRLAEPARVKKAARIFVCSMGDLFGPWVPAIWIARVMEMARSCPWHTFQFLTKSPDFAEHVEFPKNAWAGTSVTGMQMDWTERLDSLRRYHSRIRFLSCEPLCGLVDVARGEPDWIIIGPATGPGGFQPEVEWVRAIESYADRFGVPVFHKDSLACRQGDDRRTEFPKTAHNRRDAAMEERTT